MSRWLATGAAIAGLMIAEVSMALPTELGTLRPLGEGSLRWFGFRLYDATLYTQQGQPFDWSRPFALSLRYARDIPAAKIVDISLEEMQRYGMPDNRRDTWRSQLLGAFPDVKQGDEIIGAFDGSRVRFWHNDKPTRTLDDPLFGRTFFRIWLDPASRAPALREQLLKSAS